jgi:formiminotetrahydrofolate cyclodeaminase
MDAQHAAYWREVTAKLQEAVARSAQSPAGSVGDTADALQALEKLLGDSDAVESGVVEDAAMVTAALQEAADAQLFVVDRQGDAVTSLE